MGEQQVNPVPRTVKAQSTLTANESEIAAELQHERVFHRLVGCDGIFRIGNRAFGQHGHFIF